MYSVVGCGDCGSVWIVDGDPETTTCRRCGKRHRFASLRKLERTDDKQAAAEARSKILAERAMDDTGVELPHVAEMERELARDQPSTASVTTDSNSSSRETVVRRAIRALDAPTAEAIAAFANERGVPEPAAHRILEDLVNSGEVTTDDGRYRLL